MRHIPIDHNSLEADKEVLEKTLVNFKYTLQKQRFTSKIIFKACLKLFLHVSLDILPALASTSILHRIKIIKKCIVSVPDGDDPTCII